MGRKRLAAGLAGLTALVAAILIAGAHVAGLLAVVLVLALAVALVPTSRGSDRRVRRIVELASEGGAAIVSLSLPGWTIDNWNPAAGRLFGYEAHEAVGHGIRLLVPDDRLEDSQDAFAAVLKSETVLLETRQRRPDGQELDLGLTIGPLLDRHGVVVGASMVAIDITGNATTLRAQRRAGDQFRGVFDHAPVGMGVVSLHGHSHGRVLHVNPALCQMTGFSEADLLAKNFTEFVHPAERDEAARAMARLVNGADHTYEAERQLLRANGESIWVEVTASVIRDEAGRPTYGLSQLRDITAGRQAEEARSRLVAIVDASSDAIIATDRDRRITAWNPGAEALFGHSREGVLGRDFSAVMHAVPPRDEPLLIERALLGDSVAVHDASRAHRDGSTIDVSVSVAPIRSEAGEIVGASEIARDMTDEKAAAAALRASERSLRQIVETANEGIWTLDTDGRTTFANPKLADILGTTVEAMHGAAVFDFVHESDHPEIVRLLEGDGEQFEVRLLRPDGADAWGLLAASRLDDAEGKPAGVLAMVADITARRATERKLGQAQRLDGLGQLAGGVAHDMNNLLGVILNFSEFGLDRVGHGAGHEELTEIRSAAQRAAALTRQLLVFARREIARPEKVDLNEMLGTVDTMLRRTIGAHIALSCRTSPGLPTVMVDPGLVEQVLLNLVVNARDAMPGGGHVTIATDAVYLTRAELRSHGGLTPGRYVCLSVEDDGDGMSEDAVSRAFDPFFTTKPATLGTGLGLATVYGVVSKGGGHVKLESELGRGTVVSVYLPTCDAAADVAPADAEPPAVSPLRGTVLVVEDDEGVRDVAVQILERYGHHVLAAPGPVEALEIMNSESCPVELVVTDVVMPEMSGPQMARRLADTRPHVPVVFVSGYTDRPEDLPQDATLLQKPFTRAELLTLVGASLSEGPAGASAHAGREQ